MKRMARGQVWDVNRLPDSAALRFRVVENVKAEITYASQREVLERQLRQDGIRGY